MTQHLTDQQLEETDAGVVAQRAAQVITSMGADIRALTAERDRYRAAWQSARFRAQAYGEGILQVVEDRESYQGWLREAEARIAELERPAVEAKRADTLPAWLRQRFTASAVPWERLDDGEQSYWEHQAAAVRRAVARGGFRTPPRPSGASLAPEPAPKAAGHAETPARPSHGHTATPEGTGGPQTPAHGLEAPEPHTTPQTPPQGRTAAHTPTEETNR